MQKEKEETERKQAEAAIVREQQQQELIKAKEMEILQLQVRWKCLLVRFLNVDVSFQPGWLFLQQEEAKNFITLENLDQRIEEALDNPKNYNFAVDKEGRVVKQTLLQ